MRKLMVFASFLLMAPLTVCGQSPGETIEIIAEASDPVVAGQETSGVRGVVFLIDGIAQGIEDTAEPYSYSWDTTGWSLGVHVLTATACDNAGNCATSAPVDVTLSLLPDTTPPAVILTVP